MPTVPSCRCACCCATAGAVVREYGRADLKEVEAALFQPYHGVAAWFVPDVKLGCLAGGMESPACFGADIYAVVRAVSVAALVVKRRIHAQCVAALVCVLER